MPDQERISVRRSVLRGMQLAWDASPPAFIGIAMLAMVGAAIAPVLVWLGKHLIDLIVEGLGGVLAFSDVLPTVIGIGALTAVQRALSSVQNSEQDLFAYRVAHHGMRKFLRQAGSVDLGHFDNSDWHDRMARAMEVQWRSRDLTFASIGLAGNIVGIVGMLGLLASLHPLLVVLSLVSLVPIATVQRRLNRLIYGWHYTWTPDDREENYMERLLGQAETSKVVRAYGLVDHFMGRHDTIAWRKYRSLAKLHRRWMASAIGSSLLGGLALAIAYGFVASRGLGGSLTPGDLAAVVGAFTAVNSQSMLVLNTLLRAEQHGTFLTDYFSFLAIEPLVKVRSDPRPTPTTPAGIRFEDVHFTYPRASTPALRGVDLHVDPGELVALVGENGAGKSTIVNLMLRFYDTASGQVRFGAEDVRDLDPLDLRERFGVLFQDFARFELSLRENVTLGRVEREADDGEVLSRLESARARWLMNTLNDGLDSKVGRLFEGGHDLSGGEWQRLALARLIHRDADIWVLDEPTSNLDPLAEAEIFSELRDHLHGRMGIVISHRFSTVRVCDRIYVIRDGVVAESGSHEELIARGGRYSELFELQAAGYR